jgi:hypothetical protein
MIKIWMSIKSIIETKFDNFCILTFCNEVLPWMLDIIWMKIYLVGDSNCNVINPYFPQKNYKEWQIMLGLYLVLLTLHMCFTIRIEQNK